MIFEGNKLDLLILIEFVQPTSWTIIMKILKGSSVISALILSVVLGGGLTSQCLALRPEQVLPLTLRSNQVEPTLAQSRIPPETSAAGSNFITAVVQKVGPAVVRIDSTRVIQSSHSAQSENPLSRFRGQTQSQKPAVEEGIGSGFIISPYGEILTNAHVVNGSQTVSVTLKDGRTYQGTVLGTDPVTDVAVVKIDADNLPVADLGDSANLQPGEWAIAIGNPLGLNNTVTVGIVSATGRPSGEIGSPNERVNYIQTDAAINPGNSGGPLLDQDGKVIGINTAIIDGTQGLGFSIPIETAKHIADEIISTGKAQHAYIGVQMLSLTPEIAQSVNHHMKGVLNDDHGVLILQVMPKSPADRAGLKVGDVIDQVNGKSVTTASQIQQIVDDASVGSDLPLQVNRKGKTLDITVQLGNLQQ
jgi:S1-C subfamily serine protease